MSTRSLIWGSIALVMTVSCAAAQAAAADAAEQTVTAAEHQWLKSEQTNTPELLAPLLADKVIETTDEGKVFVGKDAVLADAKSVNWTSAEYKDFKVTVFGSTAIATGTYIGKGVSAAGKPLDVRLRFTDSWVNIANGKWVCVASHDSALKM